MAIPQQVQDQADRAEEIQKGLTADPNAPKSPGSPEGPAAAANAQPAETLETLMPKYEALLAQEQKYKTLQGMFNKKVQDEVDRQLAEALRKERILNGEIADKDRKIAELEAKLKKTPDPSAAGNVEAMYTPEELEALGDEGLSPKALEILGRKMKQTSTDATKPMQDQVKKTTEDAKLERTNQFYTRLGKAVPDWENINAMAPWHEWLSKRVPGTNYKRQAIIDAAQQALDPTDIINLLNDYKAINPDTFAAPANDPSKTNMERQVETIKPDTTTPHNPTRPGKIWSAKEVSQTLTAIATRKGTGGQADIDLEREIEKAYEDGRVSG